MNIEVKTIESIISKLDSRIEIASGAFKQFDGFLKARDLLKYIGGNLNFTDVEMDKVLDNYEYCRSKNESDLKQFQKIRDSLVELFSIKDLFDISEDERQALELKYKIKEL